jgi:Arc/MetJ-type ribon-helix-helix transcriptional regulator
MSQPTTAVSLRISDEDLALLELRVGTAGTRNRSDVVRLAIQEFLHNQPQIQDMQSVRIPVGRHDLAQLGKLYELRGVTVEQAAQEGLSLYIQKVTDEILASNNALDAVLEQVREETIRRSEYQA